MFQVRFVFLNWLVFGVFGCGDASVTGVQPPDTRVIAFSSDSNSVGGMSIFVMHADGSQKLRLTASGAFDQFPTWSPDGRMIAFDSDRADGITSIWAMDADGSNPRMLANGYGARWSPDGTHLLFTAKLQSGIYAVFVANADGSNAHRLTTNPAGEVRPAWSPNGTQIVFSAYPDGNMNLYLANPDGSNQQQITNTKGYSQDAAWSPDGMRIAFAHGEGGGLSAVHIINIDGTQDRKLSALGCGGPAWSPDSQDLTFTCATDTKPRIFRMHADGSGKLPLTSLGFSSVGAAWRPTN